MELSRDEILRYSRHLLIPEVGLEGQRKLKAASDKVITLDAVELAEKAGNRQSTNVVMVGALFGSGKMPISPETMKEHIAAKFAGKGADVNIKAFDLGYEVVKKQM